MNIKATAKVALARVVLTNREHIIAVKARDKGLMGMPLRYPYEVRQAADYFDDIRDVKIIKNMLDLAKHIVDQKCGHFDPELFEDHYENALTELLARKQRACRSQRLKDRKPIMWLISWELFVKARNLDPHRSRSSPTDRRRKWIGLCNQQ
jgi:DNA end-binding protein Ku